MARSGKESSMHQSSSMADEDFYNPMPQRQFSKNYQPSLTLNSNSNDYSNHSYLNAISYRPGIELIQTGNNLK